MLFSDISIITDTMEYQPHSYVVVDDSTGTINYVGTQDPRDLSENVSNIPFDNEGDHARNNQESASYGRVYNGRNRLLIPAFYNAHAHSPMPLLRGYGENQPLQTWLYDWMFPFEAKMTEDDTYWGTLLSCAEMLRYGIVGFSDMYDRMKYRAKSAQESGMKAMLSDSVISMRPQHYIDHPRYAETIQNMKEIPCSGDARVQMELSIHAEYTSEEGICREIIDFAREHNLGLHIHMSETKLEHEECKARHHGKTPVQYFEHIGAFDVPVLAAHCVWTEPEDIRILSDHGATVALNPASNMKLGSGLDSFEKFMGSGINVALGTDGMASNNNYDMIQDMCLMSLIEKGFSRNPAALDPKDIFYSATRAGALAQQRENCGFIREGFKADLAVLDISGPSWTPMTNPLGNLLYSGHGSDVVLTMCDGEVLYEDGTWNTIDIGRAKNEVKARSKRILSELALDKKTRDSATSK